MGMSNAPKDAGARFAVSPGLTEQIVRKTLRPRRTLASSWCCDRIGHHADAGLDLGLARFKFFPAETSGGTATLKAFQGPFRELATFARAGGITLENAPRLSRAPKRAVRRRNLDCARAELVKARDWTAIALRAREATHLKAGATPTGKIHRFLVADTPDFCIRAALQSGVQRSLCWNRPVRAVCLRASGYRYHIRAR